MVFPEVKILNTKAIVQRNKKREKKTFENFVLFLSLVLSVPTEDILIVKM